MADEQTAVKADQSAREKNGSDNGASPRSPFTAPQISLPKGGGAIRGIGEKFATNPVTGTGSLTVPIALSPGRSGFGPQLSLSYDSGTGNGPFGMGCNLALPAITRKTDKGLPRYLDAEESDVFILSGAEDLVPVLKRDERDEWVFDEFDRDGYRVKRYRPRVEGLFARIERWTRRSDGDTHWRSISKDNVLTVYGFDGESRISDPSEPSRVFSWLICQSYDDKGNAVIYNYAGENDHGVDLTKANERNRIRTANRYLKRIRYGNRKPLLLRRSHIGRPDFESVNWMFDAVFDYGDGHYREEPCDDDGRVFVHASIARAPECHWPVRQDPFSSYRSGFEVRTYRLCRRVLMFHHFPEELGVDDYLVRSTEFEYHQKTIGSFVARVIQSGYKRWPDGRYLKSSLPPLDLTYSSSPLEDPCFDGFQLKEVGSESLENLPAGFDGDSYRLIDLDGEGISGVLSQQGPAWFYKHNLGQGQFGAIETVAIKPSLSALNSGRQQLLDVAGDGNLDLVELTLPVPGFYERTLDEGWAAFRPFRSLPSRDWDDSNLRFVDVTGDGIADVLITQDDAFTWHPSLLKEGFGDAVRVRVPYDEEEGPRIVFADGTQSIYLADMSGDGLSDLVRIRNGEVCYWPNRGYGRFGAKVTMNNSPWFDDPDLFEQRRVRLADTDGSGTTDILYLGRDNVRVYLNETGNGWSNVRLLKKFLPTDKLNSISILDFLGRGTACLLWSSPLPGDSQRPLRYVDLMCGQKPHLLTRVKNNLGAETVIEYASSTEFYLADKLAGTPWVTRLAFPVHVVKRVETFDWVSRNRFVTRYSYHHGYFDGQEREFRGFGRVDQLDTEELAALTESGAFPIGKNEAGASNVPPVLTKTWFHTGAYLAGGRITRQYEHEYYKEGESDRGESELSREEEEAMLLADTILPEELTPEEAREACRALKGSLLRQEIYALDDTPESPRPYIVSESNYTVRPLQPHDLNRHAVFFTRARETISFAYERKVYRIGERWLADPRVSHTLVLAVDDYGNVLLSATVGYGRRHNDPDPLLKPEDHANQRRIHVTCTQSRYTNPILELDSYRIPLPAEVRTYELIKVKPERSVPNVTNLFRFDEILHRIRQASDGRHDLPYEDVDAAGATQHHPYRRLIECVRTLYRKNDLSAGLPLGTLESLALPFEGYKLAFTPGLFGVYQRDGQNLLPDLVTVLRVEGAYVLSDDQKALGLFPDCDPDGHWWIPSGKVFYSPNPDDTPAREVEEARSHFFLSRRYQDPFGNQSKVFYDPHRLLALETVDALHNRITIGERQSGGCIRNGNDYRVLQPALLTDPNGNRSAVAFDALGLVAGTAVTGKTTESLGDSLAGFRSDLTQRELDEFYADPKGPIAATLLGYATTRIVYDLTRFLRAGNERDPSKPVYAAGIARETHVSDLDPGESSKLQVSIGYSDGFGRVIQSKRQAEPGPLRPDGRFADPRWVGSGWTIFNNKGKPVRQYEPFFDDTHEFKFGLTVGVSPILFYDPVGRVIVTLHPNHSWEKVVFDPWLQRTWDVNDTVLIADPANDRDAGAFFQHLAVADYFPTWYRARIDGALGPNERDSAEKVAAHAHTPTTAVFDTLGRTFLTIAFNRYPDRGAIVESHDRTLIELDIEGNQRSITDALNRMIMVYCYDMLSTRIRQDSVDAGARWMLNNAVGESLRRWDSRAHRFRYEYDALQRPSNLFVQIGDDAEYLAERVVYGENQTDAEALNLRTKIFQQFDQAGVRTDNAYDFKGNLLSTTRQLSRNYKGPVDWSPAVVEGASLARPGSTQRNDFARSTRLENETFSASITFDALNRPVTSTAPDGSVIRPAYNETNLLQQIVVNLRGSATRTPFATNIEYNAKAQRELIEFGNGARTTYAYDPETFRLIHLTTARRSACERLQDLKYTFDPAGNITQISDSAQQTIYFRNQVATANSAYEYDAVYRLIKATGREHLGQTNGHLNAPPQVTADDSFRMNLPQPGDGYAMGNYTERYRYDADGNILRVKHTTSAGGWTRHYNYEPQSNRLIGTSLPGDSEGQFSATYAYDADGNMVRMPHLTSMGWDFKDQLHETQRQVAGGGSCERTYYVYDSGGQRVRKVTQGASGRKRQERIYIGGFEVYREYDQDGEIKLERETLHVMDDKQRVALVETKTIGKNIPPGPLIRYQFGNHLGSAVLELDEHAKIISYEEYYPYGSTSYQAVRSQIDTPKRYRFTGKERDTENDFFYHGMRYYVPWLGRWISCDPAGSVDGPSVYVYARNNPVRLLDRHGAQAAPPKIDATDSQNEATDPQKQASPPAKQDQGGQADQGPLPAPVTQASLSNPGTPLLKKDDRNLEVQLGGSVDTSGAGQFPLFQFRYGWGHTDTTSFHILGTVASAGPSPWAGQNRPPNTSPGSLGGMAQIGTADGFVPGWYFSAGFLFAQNPPQPEPPLLGSTGQQGNKSNPDSTGPQVNAANPYANAMAAWSVEPKVNWGHGFDPKLHIDVNAFVGYAHFGSVLGNPASDIFTESPVVNFALSRGGGKWTYNLEGRVDFNEALNASLPTSSNAAYSYKVSGGAGIQYSDVPGRYSLGVSVLAGHEFSFGNENGATGVTIFLSYSGFPVSDFLRTR